MREQGTIFFMEYGKFQREMWRNNCTERRLYREEQLELDEYILQNGDFLLDKFKELCNNQV